MCQGQRLAGDERIPGVFTARVTLARRMEAAVIRWAGHKGHSPLDCSSSPGWGCRIWDRGAFTCGGLSIFKGSSIDDEPKSCILVTCRELL